MLDVSKDLVSKLKKILPTYLEQFLDASCEIPCISYFLYDDTQYLTGDKLGYSKVSYCIKVWDRDMANLSNNSIKVDKVMRELGYERVSSKLQKQDNLLCNLFVYRGLGLEKF